MPQPVDLHTEIGRIAAAERIQQISDRLSLAAQQRLNQATEEARIQEETQVQQTNQTESERVAADGRRQNPFAGRRHRRKQGDEGAEKGPEEGESGKTPEEHIFDVSV